MKAFKIVAVMTLAFLMSACGSSVKFPISTVTPAADIVFSKNHDHNGNTTVKITAKNLASVNRIESHQKVYLVWIMTDKDGPKNIGALKNKNAQLAELKTLTPYKFNEIFITAEEQADVSYPSGIEISRIRF